MLSNAMKTFLAAARAGSFNRAAEELYISSTAVTKQMNALEKHLGVRLFIRSSHGAQLTPAGEVINRYGTEMEQIAERAVREAKQVSSADEYVIHVGTSHLYPSKPFVDLWYRICAHFPEYKLLLVPLEDKAAFQELTYDIGGKCDLLIGPNDSRAWLKNANFLKLFDTKQAIAVPRSHRFMERTELSVEDLRGETILCFPEGDSPTVDAARRELSIYPDIHLIDTAGYFDVGVFNECERLGCLLLTLECWKEVHPALKTIPVTWGYTIPFGITYAKACRPEVRNLITAIEEYQESVNRAEALQ